MQAILNIELDAKVGPTLTTEQRFSAVMHRVRNFFTRSIGELQTSEYLGPDGMVNESVAVIVFESAASKEAILTAIAKISADFNQDCIAVRFADGDGRLAGPAADKWGPFNPAYFKTPAFLYAAAA